MFGAFLRDSDVWHRRCADVIDQINSAVVPLSTGISNAYVLAPDIPITSLKNGQIFTFVPNFTNTSAATVNISGIGAVSLKRFDNSTNIYSGEVVSGYPISIQYNSTGPTFRLLTVTPVAQTFSPTITASGSMTISAQSITKARYTIQGPLVRLYLEFSVTTAGTASTDIICPLPIAQAQALTAMAYVVDGAGQPAEGFCAITGGNAIFRKKDATNFGLGSGRECRVLAEYEI